MHSATLTMPVTYDTAMLFTDTAGPGHSTAAATNHAVRPTPGVAR
ncbi:hypothetical protein ACH4FX_37225 [Streptomyces sp. NPDC018019]